MLKYTYRHSYIWLYASSVAWLHMRSKHIASKYTSFQYFLLLTKIKYTAILPQLPYFLFVKDYFSCFSFLRNESYTVCFKLLCKLEFLKYFQEYLLCPDETKLQFVYYTFNKHYTLISSKYLEKKAIVIVGRDVSCKKGAFMHQLIMQIAVVVVEMWQKMNKQKDKGSCSKKSQPKIESISGLSNAIHCQQQQGKDNNLQSNK